jgi:hypothetical protein
MTASDSINNITFLPGDSISVAAMLYLNSDYLSCSFIDTVHVDFVHTFKSYALLFLVALFSFALLLISKLRVASVDEGESDFAYMVTDDPSGDWDSRKFNKCKPYSGEKGTRWTIFVRDFGNAMSAEHDEDSDLNETLQGIDPGGDVWALGPVLAAGGHGAVPPVPNAASARRRKKRLQSLYNYLYSHVPDHRLREMIQSAAPLDGRAAFILLNEHCNLAITDLEIHVLDKDWENATIRASVGVNLNSITMFKRHLDGLNYQRPANLKKSNDDLAKKFLLSIDSSLSNVLHLEAAKELRNPPARRQFWDAVTNQRDFNEAVSSFDDLWRSQFADGQIRSQAKGKAVARVEDAAVADDGCDDCFEAGDDAFAFAASTRNVVINQDIEARCWNCNGFGHTNDVCPSTRGRRQISKAIEKLANEEKERSSAGRVGKGGRGGRRGVVIHQG